MEADLTSLSAPSPRLDAHNNTDVKLDKYGRDLSLSKVIEGFILYAKERAINKYKVNVVHTLERIKKL